MIEFEFSINQNLRYEDAVESMFDLLDFFADSDSFDEIDWDGANDAAFVANDDMEVELVLNEGSIDVFVAIHARDLRERDIRSNLTQDISQFFGLDHRRSSQPHRRNWREEGAGSRELSESTDTGRSRKQGSGRFGRLRPGPGGSSETESRTKSRPSSLSARREEAPMRREEEVSARREEAVKSPSERKAPTPLKKTDHADSKASERLEAKSQESKESKKPPHGLGAKPVVQPAPQAVEKKEEGGSGFWWWVFLLVLIGGGIAWYLSPAWPWK